MTDLDTFSTRDAGPDGPTIAILATDAQQAEGLVRMLSDLNIPTVHHATVAALAKALDTCTDVVLVPEDGLDPSDRAALSAALDRQPSWSDVPVILLAGQTGPAGSGLDAGRLATAVRLPHPVCPDDLARAVRTALIARRRQHQSRAQLAALRQREAELRDSEAKFHAIADSVDQMIWSTRPDGFHDYYNRRWYEFTGMPEGSTDGEAWNGMFHPEDQDHAWKVWRQSLVTGEIYEIEYRLRHHSGQYRWVLGRAQPVRAPDGTILRWYGTCTDIDDEVRAREATVSDLTRQRDVAWDMTVDLIAVVNADATLDRLNSAWTRILGWPIGDTLGRDFLTLTHPDDVTRTAETFATVFDTPLTDPFEFRLRHADGSYRWFAWTASAQDGQVYAVGRDVTERIARAERLAATEAALRQSQKLEMIGQLTGGVAHDFNNLLMATRASLDLLRRHLGQADDRTLALIGNATHAIERGAALTQRMLAFARKQDLHSVAVDMGAAIPGMTDLIRRSIGPQIEVGISVAPDLPLADIDLNQFEMALLNLAVNGRDAMDGAGHLTITVDAADGRDRPDLKPGSYVRVAVSDTGCGMDDTTLAHAAEPFFTTKGVGKGTGLGLSMVHGLAVQSGGTFTLDSRVGVGTTATLYLPAAAPSAAVSIPDLSAPAPDDATLQKARLVILAVDDDVLVSLGTVGVLEDLGHEVLSAHSGAAALDILAERPDIDLVLTDQAMPKMTGVDLARRIRDTRPDMPIILATGYADMPEGGHALITERLEKPFSDAALERLLRRYQA